ncbi:MAG: hypothetical protein K2O06_13670 [Acetatifactor sp.]|nr:hypothetical protein [Acetatifactor sp.]
MRICRKKKPLRLTDSTQLKVRLRLKDSTQLKVRIRPKDSTQLKVRLRLKDRRQMCRAAERMKTDRMLRQPYQCRG